jgi:hypothetical protein
LPAEVRDALSCCSCRITRAQPLYLAGAKQDVRTIRCRIGGIAGAGIQIGSGHIRAHVLWRDLSGEAGWRVELALRTADHTTSAQFDVVLSGDICKKDPNVRLQTVPDLIRLA